MMAKLTTRLTLLLAVLAITVASCRKKQLYISEFPNISFKTGAGYTYANDTIPQGDTVLIGVMADNNGSVDKLSTLVIRRAINSVPFETVKEVFMTGSEGTNYSGDFKFILNTPGTQVYKFIVVNAHGLDSEKTITFTVSQ